ncbi:MAG: hypothetical protein N3G74_00855 [Candidatus Micrarchaeota archaeon]|nr:hypothetical protein [Candidatus Micrarchaeota archaeon]
MAQKAVQMPQTESVEKEIQRVKEEVREIAGKPVESFTVDDLANAKGAFFRVPLSINEREFKKRLLAELYVFARENSYSLVFRIGEENGKAVLYVNKSYAREIAFFLPDREVIQSFVGNAISSKNLTGKGYELYANPNMGFIALVYNGKVEEVSVLSGSSISVRLKTGKFVLGGLEKGGWNIPPTRKEFIEFAKEPENKGSFSSSTTPYPESIFNLMGSGKMQFSGTEKLHFRSLIYPGFKGEVPLGSEAGIIDDLYNQTTAGCLFIGEGSFYVVKRGEGFLLGADMNTREKDIGMLIKKGEVQLEELPIGTQLRMRNGKYATLSEDKYGNKVWLDENRYYVPFDSISFDWDAEDMPQVIWKPPEYGKSKFINAQTAGRNLYIDTQSYYIMEKEDSIQVVVYPDRYNIAEKNISDKIKSEINRKGRMLEENDLKMLERAFIISQLLPFVINIGL